MRSKVLIIYTGGTIGMVEDAASSALHPVDFNRLLEEIPELKKLAVELSVESFETPIDSSNLQPKHWLALAKQIQQNYNSYDGFVLLHGSDTMAYTGSVLSYLLGDIDKAVILTGSQLPMGKLRTDGKENLITAIEIAADKSDGVSRVPEVAIYFEYSLYRANRTSKVSAEHFEAFQSPNYPLLAEAGVNINYNDYAIAKRLKTYEKKKIGLDVNVASVKFFPGIQKNVFDAVLSIEGLKGLIIETYGSGNAPESTWLKDLLKKTVDNGIVVVNVTQCTSGKVDQSKYETGTHLKDVGIISAADMTFEAAMTKLMYLLAKDGWSTQEVKKHFLKNLAGEISSQAKSKNQ